jgi:glycosyltransferase involved in cell wall biosynthesis
VILSFRNEPGLVEAVQSVMAQNHRPEIVVVNSGGGDPSATLAAAGLEARLIDNPEPLYPGAARNVGIRATRSRFVSFLAADCRAEPGWAAMRLHGHRAGAELVASAMTNGNPESRSARAAYVLLHSRRMPDAPPRFRALYGLSYDRRLFERHGGFREDLRQGEDTEFRQRIESLKVLWAPEVRTAHWNPDRPAALVRDLYARGQRSLMFEGLSIPAFSLAIGRPPVAGLIQALRVRDRAERRRLLAASPLLVPAALAYAAGVVTGRRARRGGADRPDDVLDGRNSRGARQ